jgi:DNA-3-methyladenine glycosylase I
MRGDCMKCNWCLGEPIYIRYHDEEWGVPVRNDQQHFENLILELMHSGLSWLTVLRKRENFRTAFVNFNPIKIAAFDEEKIEELLKNEGIIRHRKKIEATIINAKQFIRIQQEYGSFNDYIWKYVNNEPVMNHYQELSQVPAKTELSDQISKELKQRGFKFLGSVTIYSYLQASGLINDHLEDCELKYHSS